MDCRDGYQIHYQGVELHLPGGVRFVTPEFVSACVAACEQVSDAPYLIDLQRNATLAGSKPANDARPTQDTQVDPPPAAS